jgi:hypothetical protein
MKWKNFEPMLLDSTRFYVGDWLIGKFNLIQNWWDQLPHHFLKLLWLQNNFYLADFVHWIHQKKTVCTFKKPLMVNKTWTWPDQLKNMAAILLSLQSADWSVLGVVVDSWVHTLRKFFFAGGTECRSSSRRISLSDYSLIVKAHSGSSQLGEL